MKPLFLFAPLLLVIVIAIVMVLYKRKQTYNARRRPREPYVSAAKKQKLSKENITTDLTDYNNDDNNDSIVEGIISKPRIVQKAGATRQHSAMSNNKSQPTFAKTEMVKKTSTVTSKIDTETIKPKQYNDQAPIDDLIMLGLKANPAHPYNGYELLQALLTAGLRFGKMNIFHRHEEISGRGNILFSLASIAEPGTFELNKMGAFSTPGLMLFMRTNQLKDPTVTFEMMLATAQQLVDDLGGEILDNERKPLTEEKTTKIRNSLISLMNKEQTADLFADDH